LDFGVYKILHYKKDEIKQFIDDLLVNKVREQLKTLTDAQARTILDQIEELEDDDIIKGYYSDCLYAAKQIRECVAIQEEMLDLNPNDNQGVRDQLLLYLIQIDETEKFKKYADMFPDDIGAHALFNRALFAFKTEGDSKAANNKLQKAVTENPYVANRILAHKPVKGLAEHYGFGSEEEADYYALSARHVWRGTRGALKWLLKHSQ